MKNREKGILLLLLFLLIILLLFLLSQKSKQAPRGTGEGGGQWGIPVPPPRPPGGASEVDIVRVQLRPLWETLLFEAALEIAGEIAERLRTEQENTQELALETQTQIILEPRFEEELLRTELENSVRAALDEAIQTQYASETQTVSQTEIQTQIDNAVEVGVETALEFVLEQLHLKTTFETETEIQFLLENAAQLAVETASTEFDQRFGLSKNTEAADTQTENQLVVEVTLETALAALETALEGKGIDTSEVRQAFEDAMNQAVNEIIQTEQAVASTVTDTKVQTENELVVEVTLETALAALDTALEGKGIDTSEVRQAFEDAMNQAANEIIETEQAVVSTVTDTQVQAANELAVESILETALAALETELEGNSIDTSVIRQALEDAMNQVANEITEAEQAKAAQTAADINVQVENELAVEVTLETVLAALDTALEGKGIDISDVKLAFENEMIRLAEEMNETGRGELSTVADTNVQAANELVVEVTLETVLAALDTALEGKGVDTSAIRLALENEMFRVAEEMNDTGRGEVSSTVADTNVQLENERAVETILETVLAALETTLEGKGVDTSAIRLALENEMVRVAEEMNSTRQGEVSRVADTNVQVANERAVETILETVLQALETRRQAKGIDTSKITEALENEMVRVAEEMNEGERGKTGEMSQVNTQAELEKAREEIEYRMNESIGNRTFSVNVRLKHRLSAVTLVNRMVLGDPKYDQEGHIEIFENADGQVVTLYFENGSAFGWVCKRTIWEKYPKIKNAMLKQIYKHRARMNKINSLPGARHIDQFAQTKLGGALLELIDSLDNVSDILDVTTLFVDGFFYDPEGSGISWQPWDPVTFQDSAQKMLNKQLDYIRMYNANRDVSSDMYPYDIAQFPIIVGPLDTLDYDQWDPEHTQLRIQTEIDVIRERLLRDSSTTHHAKLRDLVFGGSEDELISVYTDPMFPGDRLVNQLDFLEKADPVAFDDLYREAFTAVCDYNGGAVYEDEYKDAPGRKRFQCGYKTYGECEQNANEFIASHGQKGQYGEWYQLDTLIDTRNGANTTLVPAGTFSGKPNACVVTGSGIRNLCKQATFSAQNYYNFAEHRCNFTAEVCQQFGTCVNETGTACVLPKSVRGVQQFFGQQLPREFIKIHGCNLDPSSVVTWDFWVNGGKKFFDDFVANKPNWNNGMKHMFIGEGATDSWFIIGSVLVPLLMSALGVGVGFITLGIIIAVGSYVVSGLIKENRTVAQGKTNYGADFTLGGWKRMVSSTDVTVNVTGGNQLVVSLQTEDANGLESVVKISIRPLELTSPTRSTLDGRTTLRGTVTGGTLDTEDIKTRIVSVLNDQTDFPRVYAIQTITPTSIQTNETDISQTFSVGNKIRLISIRWTDGTMTFKTRIKDNQVPTPEAVRTGLLSLVPNLDIRDVSVKSSTVTVKTYGYDGTLSEFQTVVSGAGTVTKSKTEYIVAAPLEVIVTGATPFGITFDALDTSKFTGFTGFVNDRGYFKKVPLIDLTTKYFPNPDKPHRKVPNGAGFTPGWITRPLRPKNSNGGIVSIEDTVDTIDSIVEKDFYTDVTTGNIAYADGENCALPLSAVESLISELTNWDFSEATRITQQKVDELNARYAPERQRLQDRVNDLRAQKNRLESACGSDGMGIFTNPDRCWSAIISAGGDAFNVAIESLDGALSQADDALKALDDILEAGAKLFFTEFANNIKGYFTRAYDMMKSGDIDLTGRCVNTRIKANFRIAKALGDVVSGKLLRNLTRDVLERLGCPDEVIDVILKIEYYGVAISTLGVSESKCNINGKIDDEVKAFSDECYMITAVDTATGTISAPGRGFKNYAADDWMGTDEYKRLCSNMNPPMIHAWSASLINKLWCLPPFPPESWADPNIGMLEPNETPYLTNRSWTNLGDGATSFMEDLPQFPWKVMSQKPDFTLRDGSADNWWYQLVYSKDDFNRDLLWDDDELLKHFSVHTITKMRIEYCEDDLYGNDQRGVEKLEPSLIDDRCWGYLSIAIAGYTYLPMTILSRVTTAVTAS